jgi:hypothetical protein
MRPATRRLLALFFLRVGACAALGALFGGATGAAALKPALLGGALGALAGVIYASMLMIFIGGAEMFLPRTRLGHALDRAPLLVTIAVKALAYCAVILVIVGGRIGLRAATIVADMTIGGDLALAIERQAMAAFNVGQLILIAFMVVSLFLLQLQLVRLVGNRTFRALALGRYHRPRTE